MSRSTIVELTRYQDAIGKTVEKVVFNSWDGLYIRFTDATLMAVTVVRGSHDESDYLGGCSPEHIGDSNLLELGYITQAEIDAERARESADRDREAREQRLREWRQLNREFAGKEQPVAKCECAFCTTYGQGACKTGKYHMNMEGNSSP